MNTIDCLSTVWSCSLYWCHMTGGFSPCDFLELGGETKNTELPSLPVYHQFLAFSTMLSLYFVTTWRASEPPLHDVKSGSELGFIRNINFKARVFSFSWALCWTSKGVFQVPVVLPWFCHMYHMYLKPNQYFLKWNLLITQEYCRECEVVSHTVLCFCHYI